MVNFLARSLFVLIILPNTHFHSESQVCCLVVFKSQPLGRIQERDTYHPAYTSPHQRVFERQISCTVCHFSPLPPVHLDLFQVVKALRFAGVQIAVGLQAGIEIGAHAGTVLLQPALIVC